MRNIATTREPYQINWHRIEHGSADPVMLLDPFQTHSGR
jgi:hypothetical protein